MFKLNSTNIGCLANGESATAETNQRHNILYAIDNVIGNDFKPLVFEVSPGCDAEIHFKAPNFLPAKSRV